MKSKLRNSMAAALMAAAPLAALLASQPAAAEYRGGHGGWDQRQLRDHQPPRITHVTPEHGERVRDQRRTRISARFVDDRSGVASVVLRLNGRDVTRRASVHASGISYSQDLAPGRHNAELLVRDRAGNVARQSWSFVVTGHDRGYGYGYGQPQRW